MRHHFSSQPDAAVEPLILPVYFDKQPFGERVTIPVDVSVKINGHKSADPTKSTPSWYGTTFSGMLCEDEVISGRYSGLIVNDHVRITADDSAGDLDTKASKRCENFSELLLYVNKEIPKEMKKVNPVPKSVMALIDAELAQHATVDEKKRALSALGSGASELALGVLKLLSTMAIVAMLF